MFLKIWSIIDKPHILLLYNMTQILTPTGEVIIRNYLFLSRKIGHGHVIWLMGFGLEKLMFSINFNGLLVLFDNLGISKNIFVFSDCIY